MVWPRGLREAGLALVAATAVLWPLATLDIGPLRILETASLDLRFRLRGPKPPGKEIAVVLVDDRSLAALGRWPLSRHLFAEGVRAANREGAKLIAFDLLFAEPDQPLPLELRDSARAAAAQLSDPRDVSLRATLDRFAADDPDGDLAEAIKTGGNVLLPLAFSFTGKPEDKPPEFLADQVYHRLDPSPVEPRFPLEPLAAVAPIAPLAKPAFGLGHVNIDTIVTARRGTTIWLYRSMAIFSPRCRCVLRLPIAE